MTAYTLAGMRAYYLAKWNNMVVTRNGAVNLAAAQVLAGKQRYKDLEKTTGVPWYVIGIIHLREGSCNFHTHLHNGDPLSARTYHVPAGRPVKGNPPFTWEYSATDALQYQGALAIKFWPIEQIAFFWEAYNGWGYRMNGYPSAYLWAGTNQYVSGKYVSDGVFDGSVVDVQLGCMAVLKSILEQTGEVVQGGVMTPTTSVPTTAPAVIPSQGPAVPVAPVTAAVTESSDARTAKAIVPVPTTADMKKVSRKAYWNNVVGNCTKTAAGGLAIFKGLDVSAIQYTQSWVAAVKTFTTDYGLYMALLALLAYVVYTNAQASWMKQDVQDGRALPSGALATLPFINPNVEHVVEALSEPVQSETPVVDLPGSLAEATPVASAIPVSA